MRHIYFFGYYLNGLEYVTYVLIPTAMVLVILTYIYFNSRVIRMSFMEELDHIKHIYDKVEEEVEDIDDLIENTEFFKTVKKNLSNNSLIDRYYKEAEEEREKEKLEREVAKELKKQKNKDK